MALMGNDHQNPDVVVGTQVTDGGLDNLRHEDVARAPGIVSRETEQIQEAQEQEVLPGAPEKEWWIDEKTKGEGDRPDFLMEKYGFNVFKQAQANKEAQSYIGELKKRLGEFSGAPEEYDYSEIETEGFGFDRESKVFRSFEDKAKTLGLTQNAVQELMSIYKEEFMSKIPNTEQEMMKLGPNADEQLRSLSSWGTNTLTEDEFETMTDLIKTAKGVRLFQKLRSLTAQAAPPSPNEVNESISRLTPNQLQSDYIKNWDEIKDNPVLQAEWKEKFKKLYG